ncbi:hypothetical protein ABZ656_18730 [Streptomyces sp. NPDC007095]|uniref:hypothetical protein n=1 Tax=Streptomyces sp. NPDC007095 TaxID=3154482 RepID=UPI0033DE3A58
MAVLLASGCYASTDYEKYPKGKFVERSSLVKSWGGESSSLQLKSDGKFSTVKLELEYFECSTGGVLKKSGDGAWETEKGRQSSEILLRFEDGCSATLWAGESGGKVVLWSTVTDSDRTLVLK